MSKFSLINGENPEAGNPQEGISHLQRLNERTPEMVMRQSELRE